MKSGDKERLETLRAMNAAVSNFEKSNPGKELDLQKILRSLESKYKQSIAAFDAGGETERADGERRELAVVSSYIDKYLPKQMDDAEIQSALTEIVAELGTPAGGANAITGKAMGMFNKKYRGLADMVKVSTILKQLVG